MSVYARTPDLFPLRRRLLSASTPLRPRSSVTSSALLLDMSGRYSRDKGLPPAGTSAGEYLCRLPRATTVNFTPAHPDDQPSDDKVEVRANFTAPPTRASLTEGSCACW
jgi:hypothetical protein